MHDKGHDSCREDVILHPKVPSLSQESDVDCQNISRGGCAYRPQALYPVQVDIVLGNFFENIVVRGRRIQTSNGRIAGQAVSPQTGLATGRAGYLHQRSGHRGRGLNALQAASSTGRANRRREDRGVALMKKWFPKWSQMRRRPEENEELRPLEQYQPRSVSWRERRKLSRMGRFFMRCEGSPHDGQ